MCVSVGSLIYCIEQCIVLFFYIWCLVCLYVFIFIFHFKCYEYKLNEYYFVCQWLKCPMSIIILMILILYIFNSKCSKFYELWLFSYTFFHHPPSIIDQTENAQHLMTISLFQPWSFTSVQSPQSARSQWWIGGEYSVYRIPPWTCLSIGVAHWDVHHRWNRLSWSNRHDHDRFPACTLMLEVLVLCRTTESIVPLWPATKFMKKK